MRERARALDVRHFVDLTVILAVTEFKLRYFGSVLGYFWTLARPLALFGVLYVAFTQFVRFGNGVQHYPAYLITAIVLFTYFQDATTKAVPSLVENESLIRKLPMPLMAIPLAISLDALFNLVLNLIAVFVFIFASGITPHATWLELPVLIGVLIVISTALGSLLANLFVVFRDMRQIWEVGAQLAFWITPIVYTIAFVPESLQRLMMMNPLAVVIVQMRHALVDPTAPSAAQAAGGREWLLIPAALVLGILVLSIYLHRRMAPRIAERV